MKSLLGKVQQLEQEAQERIAQTEEEGKKRVADLLAAEAGAVEDVRVAAGLRAQQIMKEEIGKAEAEINALKQDQQLAVDRVHDEAKAQREAAVTVALDLFKDSYLAS